MSPLKHTQWLSLLTLMSAGCTLDFDEFEPYTEEALRRQAMQDMTPPPPEEDMIVPIEDMEPPPPPVDMEPPVIDSDGDGVLDDVDNCVDLPNPDQRDDNANMIGDACEDRDGDGVLDYRYDPEAPEPYAPYDNCGDAPNPNQSDLDWDGEGDACDQDLDGDGLDVTAEEMRGTNPLKADSDLDGWRDDVDLCPLTTSRDNRDLDGDGLGDAAPGRRDPPAPGSGCLTGADGGVGVDVTIGGGLPRGGDPGGQERHRHRRTERRQDDAAACAGRRVLTDGALRDDRARV